MMLMRTREMEAGCIVLSILAPHGAGGTRAGRPTVTASGKSATATTPS